MIDFIKAALPWIIIGSVVAVSCALNSKKKSKKVNTDMEGMEPKQTDDMEQPSYQAIGMCFGMAVGSILSLLNIVPTSYGVSFGMLFGMLIGMSIKK